MAFIFEERYAGLVNEKVKKHEEKVYIPPYDKIGLVACYLARFTQMTIFAVSFYNDKDNFFFKTIIFLKKINFFDFSEC